MNTSTDIQEKQLHQIWLQQDFLNELKNSSDQVISVLNPGNYNKDSGGPDFKHARIKIGSFTFVGDVEIDIDYSDWKNHGHNINRNYNKVILHICYTNRQKQSYVYSSDGRKIHSICIQNNVAQDNLKFNISLGGQNKSLIKYSLKCSSEIQQIDHENKRKFILGLGIQRFQRKCERVYRRLKELKFITDLEISEPIIRFELSKEFNKREFQHSDFKNKSYWNQIFYELVFEALGYSKNKNIMLKLAQNVSIDFLSRFKSSQDFFVIIQSVLFNVSGLLPQIRVDGANNSDYIIKLNEYWEKIGKEYDGKKFDETQWQFLGQRPQNFPTVRIAGGSKIVYSIILQNLIPGMLKKISEIESVKVIIKTIRSLFIVKAGGYWQDHYIFEKSSANKINYLIGLHRADEILVNVVLPYMFVYYEIFGNELLSKKILKMYNEYEQNTDNKILENVSNGLRFFDSSQKAILSQGMIELYRNYCTKNKCLECEIGKRIFT